MDRIEHKLTPVYWFEWGIVALCDMESIAGCDADDPCNDCPHNHLKQVLRESKQMAKVYHSRIIEKFNI